MLSLHHKLPPIVMLHHVGDSLIYNSLKPYAISHEPFLRLLNFLERKHILTTTFAELARGQVGPKKQVILTFDDCSKSLLDFAVPELLRRKMKAVFYMPTAHLGLYNSWDVEEGRSRLELMDAADLLYLHSLGMEIGGHSHHHCHLDRISTEKVQEEISTCKNALEQILQNPILSFAYPYGAVPVNYQEILKDAGFQVGLGIYVPYQSTLCLRRFIYHDGDTHFTLGLKLSNAYRLYRSWSDRFK